jgi:hypothetical protein
MRALVVYESMFGNTRQVAEAVAEGLREHLATELVEVGHAGSRSAGDVDLLVVGAPTHAFGLSRPSTRAQAAQQATGAIVSGGIGLREWLGGSGAGQGRAAAAFDTRMAKPRWLPGSAARKSAGILRRLGYRMVVAPERFRVTGTTGPLLAGEGERARAWGGALGAALTATGAPRSWRARRGSR